MPLTSLTEQNKTQKLKKTRINIETKRQTCQTIKETEHIFVVCFSLIFFTREISFVTSCLLSYTLLPYRKGLALQGKKLLPRGANSFILKWTHFQKESKTILTWLPKSASLPLKIGLRSVTNSDGPVLFLHTLFRATRFIFYSVYEFFVPLLVQLLTKH